MREIRNKVATHPLVIHFQEEHAGEEQVVLLRVLSKHRSALERQAMDSIWIEEESKVSR